MHGSAECAQSAGLLTIGMCWTHFAIRSAGNMGGGAADHKGSGLSDRGNPLAAGAVPPSNERDEWSGTIAPVAPPEDNPTNLDHSRAPAMNASVLSNTFTSGYKTEAIQWSRIVGTPRFDYPIDYWVAVLGVQPEVGRIDFLSKWEPNAYCHYHRHLGATTLLVLEGEHHVVETSATETVHKVRKPGHFTRNAGGDVHMEYGGPEGAVVFFSIEAVEGGKLFDVMAADGRVLVTATIDDFVNGKLKG